MVDDEEEDHRKRTISYDIQYTSRDLQREGYDLVGANPVQTAMWDPKIPRKGIRTRMQEALEPAVPWAVRVAGYLWIPR